MLQKSVLFDCINNSFDKICVITLKRSSDRHTIIEKLLQGLDYEIFWGVDGSNLDYKELLKKISTALKYPEIKHHWQGINAGRDWVLIIAYWYL